MSFLFTKLLLSYKSIYKRFEK